MYYVYALRSKKDGHLYIGLSENPFRRLEGHNRGETRSTRARRPFELIYIERCGDRKTARQREEFLKSGGGREFLKAR